MAYEVIKEIRGRAYRYQVESVRDPQTGKRRSRWTYLGRVESERQPRADRRPRGNARERLLDALERLLAERDFADVTADAIAVEAQLAHGTFYRHFRDKRAALLAALERVREERGPSVDALRDDVATAEEAREQLCRLVDGILRKSARHPALLRTYFAMAVRDDDLRDRAAERRATVSRRLADHLAALRVRGLVTVDDPAATAGALLAMFDGFFREAVVEGTMPDETRIAGAVAVTERAVFGELPRTQPT